MSAPKKEKRPELPSLASIFDTTSQILYPPEKKTPRPRRIDQRLILYPLSVVALFVLIASREAIPIHPLLNFFSVSLDAVFAQLEEWQQEITPAPEDTAFEKDITLATATGQWLIDGSQDYLALDTVIGEMTGIAFSVEKEFTETPETIDLHFILHQGTLDWNIRSQPDPEAPVIGRQIPIGSLILIGEPITVEQCNTEREVPTLMAPVYQYFSFETADTIDITDVQQFIADNNSGKLLEQPLPRLGYILLAGQAGANSESTLVTNVFTNVDSSLMSVLTVETSNTQIQSTEVDCDLVSATNSEAELVTFATSYNELKAKYEGQLYANLTEMPADLEEYYRINFTEIGRVFNVPPAAIAAVLKAEQQRAGLLFIEGRISTANAVGDGQFIGCTWNGWSSSADCSMAKDANGSYRYLSVAHTADMRIIVRHGGYGFDWSPEGLAKWREYQATGNLEVLAGTNADPFYAPNQWAAVARYLHEAGVTQTLYDSNPDRDGENGYYTVLGRAVMAYNGGSEATAETKQSPSSNWTVGDYAYGVVQDHKSFEEEFASEEKVLTQEQSETAVAQFKTEFFSLFRRHLTESELQTLASIKQVDLASMPVESLSPTHPLIEALFIHNYSSYSQPEAMIAPYMWNVDSYYGAWYYSSLVGHPPTSPVVLQSLMSLASIDGQKAAQDSQEYQKISIVLTTDFSLLVGRDGLAGSITQLYTDLTGATLSDPQTTTRIIELSNQVITQHPEFNPYSFTKAPANDTNSQILISTFLYHFGVAVEHSPERQTVLANREVVQGEFVSPYDSAYILVKNFGVPASYQAGGYHTGVDMTIGEGTPIRAVSAGTIVYIGPLYLTGRTDQCTSGESGRGDNAVIIDHGGVLSMYSHGTNIQTNPRTNSPWHVGDAILAGEHLILEGGDGCTFGLTTAAGSHLHLELHTGEVNYKPDGQVDWQNPTRGGTFIDPFTYIPGN